MNNGLYVGPIISRKSPRWRVQEFTNYDYSTNLTTQLHEPYIPPSVAAVMITATAPLNVAGTAMASSSSCHNIVWPVKDRRIFVEFGAAQTVRLFLLDEPALLTATGGQLSSAIAEHSLVLFAGSNSTTSNAYAYSRNASQYLSVAAGQVAPYFNGVVAGGAPSAQVTSIIDPRLRQAGSTSATEPGNVFFPIRAASSNIHATAGTGAAVASSHRAPGYVRLEYLL